MTEQHTPIVLTCPEHGRYSGKGSTRRPCSKCTIARYALQINAGARSSATYQADVTGDAISNAFRNGTGIKGTRIA